MLKMTADVRVTFDLNINIHAIFLCRFLLWNIFSERSLVLGKSVPSTRPICFQENGDIACEVELFDRASSDRLREQLKNLSVIEDAKDIPRDISCSAEVYENGKETKTSLSLKFYGNRKESAMATMLAIQKLRGAFVEIRFYQGPSYPVIKMSLLVTFTVPKRQTKRSKNRMHIFRIYNIYTRIFGDRLNAELLVSKLPSRTRQYSGPGDTVYGYLHKSSVNEIRNVPVISYGDKMRELHNSYLPFSETCIFPEVKITQDRTRNSISVNFCARFNPSKMKILQIVVRNRRIPIFSKIRCIIKVNKMKSISYRLQMHGHCGGHEYFTSWQVFAESKHKKTSTIGTFRGKGPIIIMKSKRKLKVSNDEPRKQNRHIPEGLC